MTQLWMDYETRSRVNLKEVGLDRYAKHPSTEILMCAYAFDEASVALWQSRFGTMPDDLATALRNDDIQKCAWNYNFEKEISEHKAGIKTPQAGWYDPSVLAAYMSLPIGLDRAGKALEITGKKIHITGDERPVKMFSGLSKSLKKAIKNGAPEFYFKDWVTHPADWKIFCDYCVQDVISEREVHHALVSLNCPMTEEENRIWLLDQRMNGRGVYIDQDYVRNAKAMAVEESDHIIDEMKAHTGLDNPNSRNQLIEWAVERGYPFHDSLDADHIEEALKLPFLKPLLRTVLELKVKLGGSAYKKLQKIEDLIGEDGRLRAQFVYHGAHTARWSGRGVQLQNLYKPNSAVTKYSWEKK